MKKISLFALLLLLFSFALQAQVEVGADKSFDIQVSDYSTYAWSRDIDQIPQDAVFVGPNGVMLYNNESTRSKIKEAIQYELDAKGYTKQDNNPDMLIIFKVLEQPATLQTYNGYKMLRNGLDSARTPEMVEQTEVNAGTLLINIVDAKSGKVAWQAYASGILQPEMVNDESKIRQAVSGMFDQFKHRADN